MKEEQSKNTYGVITVGYGTKEQRELKIVDFLQTMMKDNRTISVCKIEDGTYVLAVENPPSTGRASQQKMWLSEESLTGLLSTAFLYFSAKGENLEELLKQSVDKNEIDYRFSDNIRPDDLMEFTHNK